MPATATNTAQTVDTQMLTHFVCAGNVICSLRVDNVPEIVEVGRTLLPIS